MTHPSHLLILALALVIGIGIHQLQNRADNDDPGAAAILALRLPDYEGVTQSVAQWQGKIIVVNYWATWCPPCREETPDLVALSHDFSGDPVQIVGISIDDDADKVQEFRDEYAIPYPLLIASGQVFEDTYKFGNAIKVLPFTVIIDRRGTVRHTKAGRVTRDEISDKVRALLDETD